jgi:hypothetical protein
VRRDHHRRPSAAARRSGRVDHDDRRRLDDHRPGGSVTTTTGPRHDVDDARTTPCTLLRSSATTQGDGAPTVSFDYFSTSRAASSSARADRSPSRRLRLASARGRRSPEGVQTPDPSSPIGSRTLALASRAVPRGRELPVLLRRARLHYAMTGAVFVDP